MPPHQHTGQACETNSILCSSTLQGYSCGLDIPRPQYTNTSIYQHLNKLRNPLQLTTRRCSQSAHLGYCATRVKSALHSGWRRRTQDPHLLVVRHLRAPVDGLGADDFGKHGVWEGKNGFASLHHKVQRPHRRARHHAQSHHRGARLPLQCHASPVRLCTYII